jgi:soluble lytic murein transglycosylase-like protein
MSIAALLSVLMFATGARVGNAQYRSPQVVTFEQFLHARARYYGIPDSVAFGVIRTESNWDVKARGKLGEVGLMQLCLSTARKITGNAKLTKKELYNPFVNAELGLFYLAMLKAKFHGNMRLALASYNQGPGKVMRARQAGEKVQMRYTNLVLRFATQARQAGLRVPVAVSGIILVGVL